MAPECLTLGIPGLAATPIAAPLTEQEESTSAYTSTLSPTYTFEHFCVHILKSLTKSKQTAKSASTNKQTKKITECPTLEHLN